MSNPAALQNMANHDPSLRKSIGRSCFVALVVLVTFIAVAVGWFIYTPHNRYPSAALDALRTDKNAVIYSLRPNGPANGDAPGTFHGYEIIGQTTLSSAEDRAVFAAELARSTKGAWDAAKCFEPRHAFRVSGSSGTFDFVMCYQCGRAQVFHPDGHSEEIRINGKPEAINQYLTRHGIPLK